MYSRDSAIWIPEHPFDPDSGIHRHNCGIAAFVPPTGGVAEDVLAAKITHTGQAEM
jgi:hypothetical protein